MKPSEFMDEMLKKKKMTANWAYWDLRPKAEEPSEDAVSASNNPEDEHESICLACALGELQAANKELFKSNENLQAEVWELKQSIDFLSRILTGK